MKNSNQTWKVISSLGSVAEFKSKAAAYRECRRLNGTKGGGTKPYTVQRTVLYSK